MIPCNFSLVILILDNESFKYNILSLDKYNVKLPSIDIEPYAEIGANIEHLLSLYIKDKNIIKYINYKLIDIDIKEQTNIYYYCFITHDIDIINSFKVPLSKYECHLPNLQKILFSLV